MTVFRAITCAALALLLSSPSMAADDYIRDQVERVKAADWAGMETITVSIDEHNYTPTDLRFKAGKPYRLQLRNVGKKDHYFTADPAAPFKRETFTCQVWGRDLTLASGAGVFSRGHLDHATAMAILADLTDATTGRTVVMISHRPDGLAGFDDILDLTPSTHR